MNFCKYTRGTLPNFRWTRINSPGEFPASLRSTNRRNDTYEARDIRHNYFPSTFSQLPPFPQLINQALIPLSCLVSEPSWTKTDEPTRCETKTSVRCGEARSGRGDSLKKGRKSDIVFPSFGKWTRRAVWKHGDDGTPFNSETHRAWYSITSESATKRSELVWSASFVVAAHDEKENRVASDKMRFWKIAFFRERKERERERE